MNTKNLIPTICIDSSDTGAKLFDLNSWLCVESKGVIQSAWSEYSILFYCINQIIAMCENSEQHVKKHINTIKDQWTLKKFDLSKVVIYGQHPDLHIQIEAFFSGVKSLLDLLAQLLSSEKIVNGKINGFHRAKKNYGGKVLNALTKNTQHKMKDTADKFYNLILSHKQSWIDQTIQARDQLIHPELGMHQLMFQLQFEEKQNKLICVNINPPTINSKPINQYAEETLKHITSFITSFTSLLKE